jgi:hypothetical protein
MFSMKHSFTTSQIVKVLPIFGFILLLTSCNNATNEVEQAKPEDSTVLQEAAITDIPFDASLTAEEWIQGIWMDNFEERPEEILGILEMVSILPEGNNLFFVIKDLDQTHYYSLLLNDRNLYDLNEVKTTVNSWINSYGQSAYSHAHIYDFTTEDLNGDATNEIIVSLEITGMTQADDGVQPFKKIQHDVITLIDKELRQDKELTAAFNTKYGVKMDVDSNLGIHEFLRQKYYAAITHTNTYEKMELILKDIGLLTSDKKVTENTFSPVKELGKNDFVVDLGYNFYNAYFVPHTNKFDTHELNVFDYPVFMIEDHGIYVYRINQIVVGTEKIHLTIEGIYHQDENTGEYITIDEESMDISLKNTDEKWVLEYKSNYLMMNKDIFDLKRVNSNEGQ